MLVRRLAATVFAGAMAFEATSSVAWTVHEDFEGQGAGNSCAPFWDAGYDSTVSIDRSASNGTKSCKMAITKGGTGWGGGMAYPNTPHAGDEMWVRFRLFLPQGFDYNVYSSGSHLKFIRMEERNSDNSIQGKVDWLWSGEGRSPSYIVSLERDAGCGSQCLQGFGATNDKPARGIWETYEMYVKFDHTSVDNGGTGRVRT